MMNEVLDVNVEKPFYIAGIREIQKITFGSEVQTGTPMQKVRQHAQAQYLILRPEGGPMIPYKNRTCGVEGFERLFHEHDVNGRGILRLHEMDHKEIWQHMPGDRTEARSFLTFEDSAYGISTTYGLVKGTNQMITYGRLSQGQLDWIANEEKKQGERVPLSEILETKADATEIRNQRLIRENSREREQENTGTVFGSLTGIFKKGKNK